MAHFRLPHTALIQHKSAVYKGRSRVKCAHATMNYTIIYVGSAHLVLIEVTILICAVHIYERHFAAGSSIYSMQAQRREGMQGSLVTLRHVMSHNDRR